MKKNLFKYIELIGICIAICIAFNGMVGWIIKPHAEDFVLEINKKETEKLSKKIDSLISVNERHRSETRQDLRKLSFILIKTIPKKDRMDAMDEFKEFFNK